MNGFRQGAQFAGCFPVSGLQRHRHSTFGYRKGSRSGTKHGGEFRAWIVAGQVVRKSFNHFLQATECFGGVRVQVLQGQRIMVKRVLRVLTDILFQQRDTFLVHDGK